MRESATNSGRLMSHTWGVRISQYLRIEDSSLPGFQLIRGLLDSTEIKNLEESARSCIGDLNQAHRFGPLPTWATPIADAVLSYVSLDSQLREPMFDQIIVNLYRVGEGIKPHIDLQKFEDTIVGLSFQPGTLVLRSLKSQPNAGEECKVEDLHDGRITRSFDLKRGDVYIIEGEARYLMSHEILPVSEDRMSVTLRKVKPEAYMSPPS